jgi:hypothetical protein
MDKRKRTGGGGSGRRSDAMSGSKPLKLGVYDRPASADRPKALRFVMIAVVAVAALLIAYFIFGQRKANSAAPAHSAFGTAGRRPSTDASGPVHLPDASSLPGCLRAAA